MLLPFVFVQTGSEVSADEKEGKPVVRRGARGTSLLRMFFSFVVISLFVNLQTNKVTFLCLIFRAS
jgi:hypothetical protein